MEIEQLKSATEDQMEMMMMMQMDKLPEFCTAYQDDVVELPSAAEAVPHFVENPPPFINHLPTTTISFAGSNPVQEPGFLPSPGGSCTTANAFSPPPPPSSCSAQKKNSMAAMREMIFRIAAMQPIHIDPESIKPPKRRNVKISKDPQSVAARHRRERISERIRILQRLVPGGTKMDTASMLDEAIHYVKFLKSQVQSLERAAANRPAAGIGFPVAMSNGSGFLPMAKAYQPSQIVQPFGDAN